MRIQAKTLNPPPPPPPPPAANFMALVGICLKKITEESGLLQKWKRRRQTDTAKEEWREKVKQQDIRQR
jgi:hypothetical protein